METLLNNRRPIAVAFTDEQVIVTLSDGSTVGNPLSWHWWLEAATDEQRKHVDFYADSIEWVDLDEGLDLEGMLRGVKPKQPRPISN